MKAKLLLLFSLSVVLISCNIEPMDQFLENTNEDPDPQNSMGNRLAEAIGYMDGTEITKQVYTYVDDKLSEITTYNKNGNDWESVATHTFSYDNTYITHKTNDVDYALYSLNNDQLMSLHYLDVYSGYEMSYSNEKLTTYMYYEGFDINEYWAYLSTCIYDENNLVELNNEMDEINGVTTGYEPESKTSFIYEGNNMAGWTTDYTVGDPEDEEMNEKIEYEYTNDKISKATEHLWIPDTSSWYKNSEIYYEYDTNGNLITQKYSDIGDGYTNNHLFDYLYFDDFANDFNEVRYSYEEGTSNNYILIFPEFIAHKTPNPYIKF